MCIHLYTAYLIVFCGSRTFPPGNFPRTFPPEKNTNNVVEIEAGMIGLKQIIFQVEAGLMKQFVVN